MPKSLRKHLWSRFLWSAAVEPYFYRHLVDVFLPFSIHTSGDCLAQARLRLREWLPPVLYLDGHQPSPLTIPHNSPHFVPDTRTFAIGRDPRCRETFSRGRLPRPPPIECRITGRCRPQFAHGGICRGDGRRSFLGRDAAQRSAAGVARGWRQGDDGGGRFDPVGSGKLACSGRVRCRRSVAYAK